MKTLMVLATLGLSGFVGTAGAYAGDRDGGRRHEPRIHERYCEPAPRLERCWIAPRYERVAVGVDDCGRPLFRMECVQPGYWGTRPIHCD
ncbi:MAG TPA: hypothetical protein VEN81_08840 [Planctomycetota bacterium]|nr:hypothetical protein [Planctomycetota bacterium]